jgi:hemoglobin
MVAKAVVAACEGLRQDYPGCCLEMQDPVSNLHEELGEPALRALVSAFYRRVRDDDLIGPMYPADDWAGAEKRLADFLVMRFGGPATYLEERGHPRLRMRHLPFSIGAAERDRWLDLMGQAMAETAVPPEIAPVLGAFFAQVADFMRNRPD